VSSAGDDTPQGWSTRFALGVLLGIALGCIGAYVTFWAIHVRAWGAVAGGPVAYAEAAAFGDAFGPIAGLLSTLALAAAVVSVFMQRSELELQRAELRETRKELKRQGAAQEATATAQREAADATRALALATRVTLEWNQSVEPGRARREVALAIAQIAHARAAILSAQAASVGTSNANLWGTLDPNQKALWDALGRMQSELDAALTVLHVTDPVGEQGDGTPG
jgi:hypothetical protein